MDEKMFINPVLAWIFRLYAFIASILLICFGAQRLDPEIKPIASFKYKVLDNYYLECLALHDGPDRVIIMSNGGFILKCADGHDPRDPHPILQPTPFIH